MFSPSSFQKDSVAREGAADQVNQHLRDEEICLLESLLQAFRVTEGEEEASSRAERLSFSSVVDQIAESLQRQPKEDLPEAIEHANAALRHYEEVLEGSASQLFHALEGMRIDQLDQDLVTSVEKVKETLIGQIDTCMNQVKRLDRCLREFAPTKKSWPLVSSITRFFRSILDKTILSHLKRARKLVVTGYGELQKRLQDYQKWDEQARKRREKFDHYRVFQTLGAETQQGFSEVYRLLKIRSIARSSSGERFLDEIHRVMKETIRPQRLALVAEEYYELLEKKLFKICRELTKKPDEELEGAETKKEAKDFIRRIRAEVHALGSVVMKWRDFVLSTHPDPYVRARLGFSERTVGPEPEETKNLMSLSHKLELLDQRFARLSQAVEDFHSASRRSQELGYFDTVIDELENMVWETRSREESTLFFQTWLDDLEEAQELYSFDTHRVAGMEKVLRLALRIDHFNVLVRDRKFQDVYHSHVRLRGPVEQKEQEERLQELGMMNQELLALRTDTSSWLQTAQTVAVKKVAAWCAIAGRLLDSLEAFIAEEKQRVPLELEELVGVVRKRRYEVLEFLYLYRSLLVRLSDLGVEQEPSLAEVLDRVHQLEGDFSYLASHHGKTKGPFNREELRGFESL